MDLWYPKLNKVGPYRDVVVKTLESGETYYIYDCPYCKHRIARRTNIEYCPVCRVPVKIGKEVSE